MDKETKEILNLFADLIDHIMERSCGCNFMGGHPDGYTIYNCPIHGKDSHDYLRTYAELKNKLE
jgi:hypothetical protein